MKGYQKTIQFLVRRIRVYENGR